MSKLRWRVPGGTIHVFECELCIVPDDREVSPNEVNGICKIILYAGGCWMINSVDFGWIDFLNYEGKDVVEAQHVAIKQFAKFLKEDIESRVQIVKILEAPNNE